MDIAPDGWISIVKLCWKTSACTIRRREPGLFTFILLQTGSPVLNEKITRQINDFKHLPLTFRSSAKDWIGCLMVSTTTSRNSPMHSWNFSRSSANSFSRSGSLSRSGLTFDKGSWFSPARLILCGNKTAAFSWNRKINGWICLQRMSDNKKILVELPSSPDTWWRHLSYNNVTRAYWKFEK